jgi:hypothetical protein
MADLEAAAERTAAVMASGAGPAERQAAAEQEMAPSNGGWPPSADVDTRLQREAELEAG